MTAIMIKTLAEKKLSCGSGRVHYYGGVYIATSPTVNVIVEICDIDWGQWESSFLIFTNEAVEFDPPTLAAQEARVFASAIVSRVEAREKLRVGYPTLDGIYPRQALQVVSSEMLEKDWQ